MPPPGSKPPPSSKPAQKFPREPYPQNLDEPPDMHVYQYPQMEDDSKMDLADNHFVSSQYNVQVPWGLQQPVDKAPEPASSTADDARQD